MGCSAPANEGGSVMVGADGMIRSEAARHVEIVLIFLAGIACSVHAATVPSPGTSEFPVPPSAFKEPARVLPALVAAEHSAVAVSATAWTANERPWNACRILAVGVGSSFGVVAGASAGIVLPLIASFGSISDRSLTVSAIVGGLAGGVLGFFLGDHVARRYCD